jgi:hypothetical protein
MKKTCGCTEDTVCDTARELAVKFAKTKSVATRKSYSWHRAVALNDVEKDYYGMPLKQISDYWPNPTYWKAHARSNG